MFKPNLPEFSGNRYFFLSPNIIYILLSQLKQERTLFVIKGTWDIALARGFTAVPMHAVCSGMMGYYIGKAKFAKTKKEEKFLINKGLWQAIMLHGLYDFFLFISPTAGSIFSMLAIPLLVGTYLKLQQKIKISIQ